MKRVILESPYAANGGRTVEDHLTYLRACMHDCLLRDESPFASHGLFTQPGVLDDLIPAERELGIYAGFIWREVADYTVVYEDFGVMSSGMSRGMRHAGSLNQPVFIRRLGEPWSEGKPSEIIFTVKAE